jgi:hypothetical protein
VVGDEGAISLCALLQHNRTLVHLDLAENRIGDQGTNSLFCLLASENPYLRRVTVADNPPASDEAIARLDALVEARQPFSIER